MPRRIRFSLRTLAVLLLWVTAAGALLYHWNSWVLERALDAHKGPALWVAFSAKGDRLISSGIDNIACVWDPETGRLVTELRGHTGLVMCANLSPGGARAVSASSDGTVRVWDAASGKQLVTIDIAQSIRPSGGPVFVDFIENDGQIVIADSWWYIHFVDSSTGAETRKAEFDLRVPAEEQQIGPTAGSWTLVPHRKWGTATKRYSIALRQAGTTEASRELLGAISFTMGGLIRSSDGARTAEVRDDGVLVRDAVSQKHLVTLRAGQGSETSPTWLSFSPDGARIAAACNDGKIRVWTRRRPEHEWGVLALPELWASLVFTAIVCWSMILDRKTLGGRLPEESPRKP